MGKGGRKGRERKEREREISHLITCTPKYGTSFGLLFFMIF